MLIARYAKEEVHDQSAFVTRIIISRDVDDASEFECTREYGN